MSRGVLVVNCGSSSIKYQLIDADSSQPLAKGLVERIGADDAVVRHVGTSDSVEHTMPLADHEAGLRAVLAAFERQAG